MSLTISPSEINDEYDYIIIGSGFGGSVSALRLTEKGYKVLVIEKGREFKAKDYPKTNWDLKRWMWLPSLKFFGIQKLTFFRHVSVLSGVGVGGGSLVYANTLPKPKRDFFNHGPWKDLDSWEEKLNPYYDLAWKMLGAEDNPLLGDNDLTLKKVAKEMGVEKSFKPTKVAVYFGEEGKTHKDPYFNGEGPSRTGCNFCGACMTGCRHNAKNTLDKNYLYLARAKGAHIISESEVSDIIPKGVKGENGYTIKFKNSTKYFSNNKSVDSKGIILAGGVLGTMPLLLKLKETHLSNLSPRLGETVRTNNESLILNVTDRKDLDMSRGVAIGSIVEIDEHSHMEVCRYGEGSGFWKIILFPFVFEKNFFKRMAKLFKKVLFSPSSWLRSFTVDDFAKRSSIILFMQHLDSTLKFKRNFRGIGTTMSSGPTPSAFIDQAAKAASSFTKVINSKPVVLSLETITGIPSTAHILGGACMGKDPESGVIDKDNKVFGYENMYVFDGSMISANPGVNPSLSITAISEYGMSKIPQKNC